MDTYIDMRKLDRANVMAVSVHVLDKALDHPILANSETPLPDEGGGIKLYLEQHILKAAKSPDAEAARFIGAGAMLGHAEAIFRDSSRFLAETRVMAERLFKIMKPMEGVASCDLVTALFTNGNVTYLALLKLDHQSAYSHELEYIDEQFDVRLTELRNALPQVKGRISACAIINDSDLVSESGILLLERERYDEGIRWFLNRFLGAQKVLDRMERTRIFRDGVEKFVRMNLKNDPDGALMIRENLYDTLLGNAYVDVKEFVYDQDALTPEGKDKLEKALRVLLDEKLEIDRIWVNQKMKARSVKTDTGFTFRADHEFWNDPARIELRRNGDGTFDFVFKGIRNTSES